MSEITTIMLSCEEKCESIANNFKDMGKSLFAMGLVDRIFKELKNNNGIAAFAIKEGVINDAPAMVILQTCREQIRDGWMGLSDELINDIVNF